MKSRGSPARKSPVQRNIEAIVRLEEDAFHSLAPGEVISNTIARVVGKIRFAYYHVAWFTGWIVINSGIVPGAPCFDPFPYNLLTTMVSLEAIFLSIFLLINQNAMSRQADHRSHLDLQINLLAEQESTEMLRMVARLCRKLDVKVDDLYDELADLEKKTDVDQLVRDLKDKLPADHDDDPSDRSIQQ